MFNDSVLIHKHTLTQFSFVLNKNSDPDSDFFTMFLLQRVTNHVLYPAGLRAYVLQKFQDVISFQL